MIGSALPFLIAYAQEIMVAKRIVATLVLIIAIFFAPWWVALPIGAIATFYFSSYYELMVLGALF